MSHTGSVRPVRRVFVLLAVTAMLLTTIAVAPASAQGSRTPTELSAEVTGGQVVLSWTPGTHRRASGQRILRRQAKHAWETLADVAAGATTYTDTTAGNHKYFYRVQNLIDGRPRGTVSNRVTVTLTANWVRAQGASSLSASVDGSAVVLSWTAGSDPRITAQRVLRRSPKGTWTTFDVAGNATTYRDTTTVSGGHYIYRLVSRAGDRDIGLSGRVVARVP